MFGRLFRRKSSTRQSPDSTSKECAMTNTLMGNATPSTTTTTPHEDVQSYAQVLTPHHKRLNGTINTVTQESEDEEHREMVLPMAMSATFASTYDGRNVAAPEEASASITPPPTTPTDPPKAPYMVTLRALYRYATPRDHLLLALGCLLSIANGALYPTMALLFGQAISQFRPTVNMDGIEHVAISYLIIALALFLTDYGAHVCFQLTAERQMQALRLHCFQHVLYKELAWFEAGNASQTTHHLSVTTLKMKQGMGIKLGDVLRCIAQFVSGYAIGFRSHWGVSMVMASVMPLMAFCLSWIIKTLRTRAIRTQKKYMEAGAIAEETLQAMRTVTSFNGFDRAVRLYVDKVRGAEMESITLARVLSMALGLFFGTIWITYAVGLWYGGRLVANVEINPKTVFTAFYGILIGTISLAQISPNLAAVINAKAAATALYAILDQPSTISAQDTTVGIVPSSTKGFGVVPGQCMGKIEVINVDFAYPSRPETMVLKDYSVTIHAGETVAFVGPSGSGKSTLVALLQRLYDPTAGRILLDGHDLQLLQLKWLRQQIGIVSQEPVLFATTIFDNIAAALVGETETKLAAAGDDPAAHEAWKNEVRRRVEAAATLAHAHTFIKSLPHGYETFVGEKGVALSGGQKQRIAIARALVRDPRILILDEATSALDTESEAVIQEAFDSIMQRQKTTYDPSEGVTFTPRTTIVIAHRLSTIRQAHRICVVVDGSIVESGTHEELISIEQGHFVQLVQTSLADTLDGTATGRPASLLWNEATQQVVESALNRESSVAMLERPTSKPLRDESIGPLSSSTTPSLSIVSVPRPVLFSTTTTIAELHYGQDIEASAITVKSEVPMAGDDHSDPLAEDDTMVGTSRSHSPPCSLRRLMQYNRPERCLYIIGLFASMLNGLSFPASAVLLSAIVSIMVNKHAAFYVTHDVRYLNELYDQVRLYSIAYIAGAIGLVAINFVQSYTFKYMAEKITTRLRTVHFKALCRQDIAYFDDPRHGSGALAGDLAALSTQAAILAGDAQGRVMQAATTFVAALMVSFLMGSWLLSFIMMIVFPLLILANITRTNQVKGAKGSGDQAEDDTARANALASESVTHIRTVAAFGLERTMVDKFKQLSIFPMRQASKEAHIEGIMLGFSSFITYAVYALVFWYGGTLVHVKRITFNELIRSLMAIMISANGIGQATSHLAEVDAGKRAAVRIFELEDRENSSTRASENDPANEFAAVEGGLVLSGAVGAIEFRNIHFTYPTRPDAKVLKDLNLMIEPGQFVALCGPSGGGKSTLIALLERFYEPTAGCIYLDGVPIRALNVQWLRSQIGLIAQEPVLFAGTVYENIAYGCLGNQEELADGEEENEMSRLTCTREQVERAAELANAHGFITSLSNGYDTYIGGSGEQLSGGQKQRIAIARAILKAPAILLLDEATSALDAESEQLVQDALERVIKMKRRTTLVIAHRMRTIRHAHKICVIANGSIVEQGSHEELVRLQGGMYAKLVESSTDERYSMMERPSIDRMSLASFA